jgi:ligand-binding SRPBCC domain-containing protein
MVHRLQRIQRLPIGLSEAWEFFSNPKNLELVTPRDLGFRITSDIPSKMYQGAIITYQVTPLLHIPATWVTEIAHISEPHYFVDRQLIGPYRLWYHEHRFREVGGGIEIEDIVHYALPFGSLGRLVNKMIVRKRIQEIFDFRRSALINKFGDIKP